MRHAAKIETIEGHQGSGRSRRLAEVLCREAGRRGTCVLVDPAGHWNGRLLASLPPGATLIRSDEIQRRGGDALSIVAVMMHATPGLLIGIDDAESLSGGRLSWDTAYAAALTTGAHLAVVLPVFSTLPGGVPRLASPRLAALAALAG